MAGRLFLLQSCINLLKPSVSRLAQALQVTDAPAVVVHILPKKQCAWFGYKMGKNYGSLPGWEGVGRTEAKEAFPQGQMLQGV